MGEARVEPSGDETGRLDEWAAGRPTAIAQVVSAPAANTVVRPDVKGLAR